MQIKSNQIKEWLNNPVTLLLIKKIKEHREANIEDIKNLALRSRNLDIIKEDILTLRGQIYTFEKLEDLEDFLIEEEVEDEMATNQMSFNS